MLYAKALEIFPTRCPKSLPNESEKVLNVQNSHALACVSQNYICAAIVYSLDVCSKSLLNESEQAVHVQSSRDSACQF